MNFLLALAVAAVSASSAPPEYSPAFANDGNLQTRWSSDFSDNEWLRIDLGSPHALAGARLHWETAHGKDYDLLTSVDGETWMPAAQVRDGDGGLDEILFASRTARFLEMRGLKRGTGWGYSLWEIEALGPEDLPKLEAATGQPGLAMDGDLQTGWRGTGRLTIDCRQPHELGGLRFFWGNPCGYTVTGSDDGKTWRELARVANSNGGFDVVYFPKQKLRFLAIELTTPGELREIEFKDEAWTPMRQFESWASFLPDGAFPRWLRREQTFWTIVGMPDDAEESLVGEDGTIEPHAGAPCVMPFLRVDGQTLTAEDFRRAHTLEAGGLPLPTVTWSGHDVKLMITAISQDGLTTVRYHVEGAGKKVSLGLAVRPLQLNPPWQYGGFAPIRQANIAGSDLRIDSRPFLRALTTPSATAVASREQGDIFTWFARGELPDSQQATDPDGVVTALYRFDVRLPADVVVTFPLHPDSPLPARVNFPRLYEAQHRAWAKRLSGWRIECPIPHLQQIMQANLAYMLLNRDYAAPQPGPRNYARAWMRDGALSAVTYRRFGFAREARQYLEWFTPLVREDGFVPFLVDAKTGQMPDFTRDWKEYDSQGEFVYAVWEDYRYTRDSEFLRREFPAVRRALSFLLARINERRADRYRGTEFFGLVPESNSHEGYFPAQHSYWDDFFAARGLSAGAELAEAVGDTEYARQLRDETQRFRKDLHASMQRVMEKRRLNYIPGCADKGDFDATSTSIAFDACDEGRALQTNPSLAAPLLAGYDRYFNEISVRFRTNAWSSFTPYEARNIEAFARLGQPERAVQLLEFLIGEPMRPAGWNLLAEVVHPDPRTGAYIGDMPHTWVGSDLINSARALFVYEDGDALVLATGIPRDWYTRRGKIVDVQNLRTLFGKISYTVEVLPDGRVRFRISGDARPPGGFRVRTSAGENRIFRPATLIIP